MMDSLPPFWIGNLLDGRILLKILLGFALDLTTNDSDGRAWDFDDEEMRNRALERVRREKPLLLIGSPMCTAFSTWQRINNLIRPKFVVDAEKKRAVQHLEFSIELYREQLRHGRYFLHEHPAYATSWQEEAMRALMGEQGVETAVCDQCMFEQYAANMPPRMITLAQRCRNFKKNAH